MDPAPSEFERVVLPAELESIRERRAGAFAEQVETSAANPQQVSPLGLAFSGGGIRSATFNLGMVQGLAERGLLRYVDYLSTVSGGGYIGSWLHGLIRNDPGDADASAKPAAPDTEQNSAAPARRESAEEVRARLAKSARQALANVEERRLSPRANPRPGRPDEDPITFLRKYSNYLAPRHGLFSADSWVIGFIWVRNVLLNQLILLAAIASLVALALIAVFLKQLPWRAKFADPWNAGFNWVAGAVAAVGLFLAGLGVALSLRQIATQSLTSTRQDGSALQQWLEPRATWMVGLVFASIVAVGGGYFSPDSRALFTWLVFFCVFIALVIQVGGGFVECFVGRRGKYPKTYVTAVFHLAWMSIAAGLLAAILVSSVWGLTEGWTLAREAWKQVVFGPPLVALALIVAVMLLVGLMGADYPDAAREWTAKIGALLGTATAAWTGLFVLAVLGPWAVSWLLGNLQSVGISAIAAWVLTTAGGVLAGNSERTDGRSGSRSRLLELLVGIAPTVFLIGYIVLVASGVHLLLDRHVRPGIVDGMTRPAPAQYAVTVDTRANVEVNVGRDEPGWLERTLQPFALFSQRYPGLLVQGDREASRLGYLLLLLALFATVTAIASARININEFSLHHFYKNRLVRAYLGASKSRQRKPTPLTGFDPLDDFPLSSLTPALTADDAGAPKRPYYGPYAILNAALNLNTGAELAQQERKATSFVFTPTFCGFDPASAREARKKKSGSDSTTASGYRATLGYAERVGPYLGTAMAISGAAANPNSGYHTSGPMAFLLTIFNARLGWWLGNPRFAGPSRKSGPTFALKYLFAELLGQTTAETKFVNLSDGGHFDNLGLYELVRRRCRFIIVCDAEEDGKLAFGSLGGAIRKCRADFGVEIEINPDRIRLQGSEHSGVHCVVGTILYPEKETAFRAGLTGTLDDQIEASRLSRGWLLYVKSSLTGDEPADVLEYRSQHRAFPHESTGDQFFSESQFESYRRLGLHVCRTVFDGVTLPARGAAAGSDLTGRYPLVSLFQQLAQKWYAPIPISAEAATRLADSYAEIMRRLADTQALQPLFKELQKRRLTDRAITPELLASGMTLMQLMQNVYTEFQLADPFNRANPKNAGWMRVFREWAASDLLQKVIWPQIRHDYHPLFHEFFESLTRDKEIDVPNRW